MAETLQTTDNPKMVAAPTVLASTGQRFGNYLLDSLFILIAVFISAIFLSIIGLGDILQRNSRLFSFIILFLYYIPQEGLFGWTLGKLITQTRVVKEDRSPISFGQAIGRTLCRFIPFDAFTFIFNAEGWHDSIPKTMVISVKKT